jgi:hypothetical protein
MGTSGGGEASVEDYSSP